MAVRLHDASTSDPPVVGFETEDGWARHPMLDAAVPSRLLLWLAGDRPVKATGTATFIASRRTISARPRREPGPGEGPGSRLMPLTIDG
jgi:hypothetical protein